MMINKIIYNLSMLFVIFHLLSCKEKPQKREVDVLCDSKFISFLDDLKDNTTLDPFIGYVFKITNNSNKNIIIDSLSFIYDFDNPVVNEMYEMYGNDTYARIKECKIKSNESKSILIPIDYSTNCIEDAKEKLNKPYINTLIFKYRVNKEIKKRKIDFVKCQKKKEIIYFIDGERKSLKIINKRYNDFSFEVKLNTNQRLQLENIIKQ